MDQKNLAEARRFVRALSPPDLAERSLPGAVEVALLRIAQEALANAVRHSGASRIAVTLSYMDDAVALDVVDDGSGFQDEGGGFGMTSMRQRAEALAGILSVESVPARGTAVAVTIPVHRS